MAIGDVLPPRCSANALISQTANIHASSAKPCHNWPRLLLTLSSIPPPTSSRSTSRALAEVRTREFGRRYAMAGVDSTAALQRSGVLIGRGRGPRHRDSSSIAIAALPSGERGKVSNAYLSHGRMVAIFAPDASPSRCSPSGMGLRRILGRGRRGAGHMGRPPTTRGSNAGTASRTCRARQGQGWQTSKRATASGDAGGNAHQGSALGVFPLHSPTTTVRTVRTRVFMDRGALTRSSACQSSSASPEASFSR